MLRSVGSAQVMLTASPTDPQGCATEPLTCKQKAPSASRQHFCSLQPMNTQPSLRSKCPRHQYCSKQSWSSWQRACLHSCFHQARQQATSLDLDAACPQLQAIMLLWCICINNIHLHQLYRKKKACAPCIRPRLHSEAASLQTPALPATRGSFMPPEDRLVQNTCPKKSSVCVHALAAWLGVRAGPFVRHTHAGAHAYATRRGTCCGQGLGQLATTSLALPTKAPVMSRKASCQYSPLQMWLRLQQ